MTLEFKNVYKSFGEKKVLQGVSFTACGGKAFGLLGRNGAGKTTSIRILMGVFPADSGEILFNGEKLDPKRVGIGYLPEERGLYPRKKIIDQLTYFALLKGMRKNDAVKAVDYWLERLGMTEYRNKRLDTLSKGNQQKIQLITALAHNPDIIILDEPFSGLDPVNAKVLREIVEEEIAKGKVVLFSSHQMNYIEEFCDSIVILNGGKAVIGGELSEIKRNYPRTKLVVRSLEAEKIKENSGLECEKPGEDELLIKLSNSEEKKDVMEKLCREFDIDEIRVFEPSLNDIFVEFATEQY